MKALTDLHFDFSKQSEVTQMAKELMFEFDKNATDLHTINVQSYKQNLNKSEFLVPLYIMWRKKIDAPTLLESATISDKRKKNIRQAITQSERNGVTYQIENPLSETSFRKFLAFYQDFNLKQGYNLLLPKTFYTEHKPENCYLISIHDESGNFFGGRLMSKLGNKLSTHYKCIVRTKLVRDGFDTVCEKLFYDIAIKTGVKYMSMGKEFNLRGIGNRKIGLIWNKLKYGYQIFLLRQVPRVYVDFAFLREKKFNLAFFVSLENKLNILKDGDQVVNLNFICGDNPNWQEIKSVKEKSLYKVNIYDRDFNLIVKPS